MHKPMRLLAAAVLFLGCSETSTPEATPEDKPQVTSEDCPTSTGATEHPFGEITQNVTWTAEGSPHLVNGDVRVMEGATLTIAPCAEVLFAENTSLHVGHADTQASLKAEGTAQKPIRFAGQDGARWGNVWVGHNGSASLAHVVVEHGGADTNINSRGASLFVTGDTEYPAVPRLRVQQVSVKGSLGLGVLLTGNSAFSEDSEGLTITGSGEQANPYPLSITPAALGSIPSGSYTGNLRDEIEVDPDLVAVEREMTVDDPGVPLRVVGIPGSHLTVASATGNAVLTLNPGVTLKFEPGTFLRVQTGSSQQVDSPGALRALGTPEKPVVFTSAQDVPMAGDWQGIAFMGATSSANNLIDNAVIAYAGGECSCGGWACAPAPYNDMNPGAIIFMGAHPPSQFITNTIIRDSAGHAVVRGWSLANGSSTVSFRDTNTFESVAGCYETFYTDENNVCSDTLPPCR